MPANPVHVAVAIIINDSNQILLARRPQGVHLEGLWEFPGGKIHHGESVRAAISRELMEEVGLYDLQTRPLITIRHNYPQQSLILHAWLVYQWRGMPAGREGQSITWASISTLPEYLMPPPDRFMINALQLPSLYLVTNGPGGVPLEYYLATLEDCLKAGARLVQLRGQDEFYRSNQAVITHTLAVCQRYDARLMLNSDPAMAANMGAHGVHLSARSLMQLDQHPLDKSFLLAASCHNRQELEQAGRIGADFAVLSPVMHTASHPGAKPLGWDKFKELVEYADVPVYALGGMQAHHLEESWQYGGQGIAMLSAVWSAATPAEVVLSCAQHPGSL